MAWSIPDPGKRLILVVILCFRSAAGAAAASPPMAPGPVVRVLSGIVVNGRRAAWPARVFTGRWPTVVPAGFLRTDAQGRFQSKPMKAGLYDVRAEAEGWWSAAR